MSNGSKPGTAMLFTLAFCSSAVAAPEDEYRRVLDTWKADEHERAVELAEAFLAEHPDFKYASAARYIAGNAALQAGAYERAIGHYRALLRDHPDYKMADNASDQIAVAYNRMRALDRCRAQCERNLERHPRSRLVPKWRYMIGLSLFRAWRFEKAAEALAAFVRDHPDSRYVDDAKDYLARIEPGWKIGDGGLVEGYAGKYADDPRLARARARLPALQERAWEVLRARLGVELDADVWFRFEDKGTSETGLRARTFVVSRKGEPATVVSFYTEHVVLSPEDFEDRAVHEMKHAGFRVALGQRYLDVPKWLREGLALHGAGQTDDRAAASLSDAVFSGRNPQDLLDGLDEPDTRHDVDDYLEDALAIEWLARREPDGAKALARRLLAGEDHEPAVAAAAGRAYPDAVRAMEGHARARVGAILGEAARAFLQWRDELFAAIRRGEEKTFAEGDGGKALRAWLAEHPDHVLVPNARYRLGKALVRNGQGAEGRKLLRRVLEHDPRRTTIGDDAAYWIARSFALDGDHDQAEEAFGIVLRDYSWSGYADDVPERYRPTGDG